MSTSFSPAPDNRKVGILWMLATLFCFISLDTIIKFLIHDYSVVEVAWARFFFATIVAIIMCGRRLPALAVSRVSRHQALRSVLLMITNVLFIMGLESTPLATATTIMFTSPLLMTILAVPLLGEEVDAHRVIGVVVGFGGAVIVVQPWHSGFAATNAGMLFLLAAAVASANYQIATRLVRADDPLTSLLYTATAGAVVSTAILPWFWSWPSPRAWILMGAMGVAGGAGHFCLIKAMKSAPASVVAPFNYTSLVWATLYGLILWGDWPDRWTWLGALLIVGSGLYIFHRERLAHANG